MVVLTLHRDFPLSAEEIDFLPQGCYPIMGRGDVIARAELELPTAHVARFAALMARAVPDADLIAEERPTAHAVALLQAGALSSPYWTHTPPLFMRIDPPGAATLANTAGTISRDRTLRIHETEEMHPDHPPAAPDQPPATENISSIQSFEDLVAVSQSIPEPSSHTEPAPQVEPARSVQPAASAGPVPPGEEMVEFRQKVSLGALLKMLPTASQAEEDEAPSVVREQPTSSISPEILSMLSSIQAQEAHTGESIQLGSWQPATEEPIVPVLPSFEAGPEPGPAVEEVVESSSEDGAFWPLVENGDLEGAREVIHKQGLPPEQRAGLYTLILDEQSARVVLGLQAAAATRWEPVAQLAGRLMHHTDAVVRRELVAALAKLTHVDTEAELSVLARDLDLTVSNAARAALRRLKKRGRSR